GSCALQYSAQARSILPVEYLEPFLVGCSSAHPDRTCVVGDGPFFVAMVPVTAPWRDFLALFLPDTCRRGLVYFELMSSARDDLAPVLAVYKLGCSASSPNHFQSTRVSMNHCRSYWR